MEKMNRLMHEIGRVMLAAMDDKTNVDVTGLITDPATVRHLAELNDEVAAALDEEAQERRRVAETWRRLR